MQNTNTATPNKSWLWLILACLLVLFIIKVKSILLPFIVGILVAYLMDPATDWLEQKIKSRGGATAIIVVAFFSIFIIALIVLVPVLVEQSMALISKLPDYFKQLESLAHNKITPLLQKIDPNGTFNVKKQVGEMSGVFISIFGNVLGNVWQGGMAFINMFSLLIISPIVSFYMLKDWDRFTAKTYQLLPRKHEPVIKAQLNEIDRTISGYLRGQGMVCLILGIFYATGLTLIGLDFGLFIGLLTGLLAFIPYLGVAIGMITGLVVAYFEFGITTPFFLVLAVFLIGQFLEGNFITPKLVGDNVGLHPVWVMFSLLSGGALFGFLGMLLAIPVGAVIGVLVRFFIKRYQESTDYLD